MRRGHDLDPLRRRQLALGEHPADLVVQDLGRRAGDGAEPGVAQLGEPLLDRHAGLGRRGHDLHRRERVHVHAGDGGPHGADEVCVEGDGQLRVDPALHAHLRGARLGRLHGPRRDLVQRQPERVGVALALGEGTEPAAHVADVREVDVPVDDVGDRVADDVAAQLVRRPGQLLERGALGEEQGHRGVGVGRVEQGRGIGRREREPGADVGVQPLGCSPPRRVELLAQRVPVAVDGREVAATVDGAARAVDGRVEVDAAGGGEPAVRLLPRAAHRDRALPGEPGTRGPPARPRARAAGCRSTASRPARTAGRP